MTIEQFEQTGIPLTNPDLLMVESACEYIAANTTLKVDLNDIETIKALPSSAKLFIVKYNEMFSVESGVTSESLGGMSQSFSTNDKNAILFDLLNSLLGSYAKSAFRFITAEKRWN